jgi:hypothetical protein
MPSKMETKERGDVEVPEPHARELEDRIQVQPERLALYQQSMQGNFWN